MKSAWFAQLKNKPCSRCGGTFPPYVMDWHHRDPSQKKFPLNAGNLTRTEESILAEVAKCDLLCANCHRIVEYGNGAVEQAALPAGK